MSMSGGSLSTLNSLPNEIVLLILETFTPVCDVLNYTKAFPNTPAFEGNNTTFWRNVYMRTTDFALPQGRSYKQACLFWGIIIRKLSDTMRSIITNQREICRYMMSLPFRTDFELWFSN